MRQKQCLLPLVALLPRFLRLLWLLLDGWGKPAHEAALNLPSGGVRRLFDSGKIGVILVCLHTLARLASRA